MFWTIFYSLFAASALAACWHNHDLRWLAYALLGGWAVSNLAVYSGIQAADRVGIYTTIEMVVSVASFMAWSARRNRWLIAVVIVCTMSIIANLAFASILEPKPRQVWLWEVTTNVCFALECVLATGAGLSDGLWLCRFRRWSGLGQPVADAHARTKGGPR